MSFNIVDGVLLYGPLEHATGPTHPSGASGDQTTAVIDASDIDAFAMTGNTGTPTVNLITVADATKTQRLVLVNRHTGSVSFASGGTLAAANIPLASSFSLAPNAVADMYFDPNANLWYSEPMASAGAVTMFKSLALSVATGAVGSTITAGTHGLAAGRTILVGTVVATTVGPLTQGDKIEPGVSIAGSGDVTITHVYPAAPIVMDVTLVGTV